MAAKQALVSILSWTRAEAFCKCNRNAATACSATNLSAAAFARVFAKLSVACDIAFTNDLARATVRRPSVLPARARRLFHRGGRTRCNTHVDRVPSNVHLNISSRHILHAEDVDAAADDSPPMCVHVFVLAVRAHANLNRISDSCGPNLGKHCPSRRFASRCNTVAAATRVPSRDTSAPTLRAPRAPGAGAACRLPLWRWAASHQPRNAASAQASRKNTVQTASAAASLDSAAADCAWGAARGATCGGAHIHARAHDRAAFTSQPPPPATQSLPESCTKLPKDGRGAPRRDWTTKRPKDGRGAPRGAGLLGSKRNLTAKWRISLGVLRRNRVEVLMQLVQQEAQTRTKARSHGSSARR